MWLGRFSGTGFEFLSDPAASVCQEDLVLRKLLFLFLKI